MIEAVSRPETPELSDLELARRVAEGDHAAFEVLMRRHNRALFRTARAILRDDAEAEDAVQEAYLKAYRTIASFRGEARLSTWLARICANEALMRQRKAARRSEIVPLVPGLTVDALEKIGEGSMTTGPEHSAERAELRKRLEARIDGLPAVYRAVFVLRAVEEYSAEETAAILQIPEATVRSRLFRARSLLREGLAAEIDRGWAETFAFAGERCDRIVANVLQRLAEAAPRR